MFSRAEIFNNPFIYYNSMEYSIMCKSCNKRVSIGDLKADKSGSGWVCLNCYKSQHPQIYKPQKPSLKLKPEPPKVKSQKIKYYCTDCGYKFYKDSSTKHTGKCPYCNTYSIRQEKDAETWINETINDSNLRFNKRVDITDDED